MGSISTAQNRVRIGVIIFVTKVNENTKVYKTQKSDGVAPLSVIRTPARTPRTLRENCRSAAALNSRFDV